MDAEMARRQSLSNFLSNSKVFCEELNNLIDTNASQLEKLMKEEVDERRLAKLNFLLGEKNGLGRVRLVLDAFREELEERNSPVKA